MDLADEQGIDAVTMRTLAKHLGIEAASLYNHVRGKDDLLDAMTELAIAEIETPAEGTPWKEAMRRRAVSAREVFTRHKWASSLIDSRNKTGPVSIGYVDRVLGILIGAGYSPAQAATAFVVVDGYIYGFERQRVSIGVEGDDEATEAAQEILEAIPDGGFPNAMKVAAEFAATPFDTDAAFEFGLGLILDGLERQLGRE